MPEDVKDSVGSFDYSQLSRPSNFTSDKHAEAAADILGQATTIEAAVGADVKDINRDDKLSDHGKRVSAREAAQKYEDSIRELEQRVAQYGQAREKIMAGLVEDMPDASDPAQSVREREIRDHLRGMGYGEVVKLYRQASQSDDMETVAAIERAPRSLAVVDSDTIQRERQARLERKFPDTAAKLRNQETLYDVTASSVAYLRRRLGLTS